MNGVYRGQTPVTVGDVPPNQDVTIELRLRGFHTVIKTLEWRGKRKLEVAIPLERAR